jgi:hypothetical protein
LKGGGHLLGATAEQFFSAGSVGELMRACEATDWKTVKNVAKSSGHESKSAIKLRSSDHIVQERPLSQRVDIWSSHVLGTESHPDHPRWDSAQSWEISQQFERPADSQGFRTAQDVLDHFVLHNELDALRSARGEIPAPLDNLQFTAERILSQKFVSEEICSGHRILDREIDADTANR